MHTFDMDIACICFTAFLSSYIVLTDALIYSAAQHTYLLSYLQNSSTIETCSGITYEL